MSETEGNLVSHTTQSILRYWEYIRGDRIWPDRASLDPVRIPELLPHLMIYQIEKDPLDFICRLSGTFIDSHLPVSPTGRRASETPQLGAPGPFWELMKQSALTGLPMAATLKDIGIHSTFATCEAVALPLSLRGSAVDQLLLGVDFVSQHRDADY